MLTSLDSAVLPSTELSVLTSLDSAVLPSTELSVLTSLDSAVLPSTELSVPSFSESVVLAPGFDDGAVVDGLVLGPVDPAGLPLLPQLVKSKHVQTNNASTIANTLNIFAVFFIFHLIIFVHFCTLILLLYYNLRQMSTIFHILPFYANIR